MMNSGNLKDKNRGRLWAEGVRTATMIDVVLSKDGEECPYKQFFSKEPTYIARPRIFGEVGTLKKNKDIFAKLENKGQTCLFVGYSEQHAADTYRLYVLETKKGCNSEGCTMDEQKV